MYLSKMLVVNFRSCKCLEIDFLVNDPNIYIGVNDCGKSSLLKAIGLLLDDKPQFNFVKENASKKDFSNSPIREEEFIAKLDSLGLPHLPYAQCQTIIVGKLTLEDADTAEDNVNLYSNQLAWAAEYNSDFVWLARSFNINDRSTHTYLLTPDQIKESTPLSFYQLGARELSSKRKEYSITEEDIQNVNGVGRYSKLEIVRALYHKTGTVRMWMEYKYEPGFFPQFSYLDWHMSFEEITRTATQVMATIIDAYIFPVKTSAFEKAIEAEAEINSKLNEMKEAIAEIAPITGLKTKVQFDVKEKITDIFVTKENSDGDIHMDLQGDGLKRQIWFAIIKASILAGHDSHKHKRFLWAFDEPETHLYPAAQRKLFDIIKTVTSQSVQSFISTHSTVFIDKSNLKAIRCIHQTENCYTDHYSCSNVDDIFLSLDIRNSDFLFFDKFLVIEGETEQHLIPRLYEIHTGRSLKEDNVQLITLRGSSNWTHQKQSLESVLTGFKKSLSDIFYLFDNDQKFIIGEGAIQSTMFFIGKQDIEDAMDNALWIQLVKDKTEGKVILDNEDVQAVKNAIPHNAKVGKNDKFLVRLNQLARHRLSSLTAEPIDYNPLPSKGIELSEAILKYVLNTSLIPLGITECFNKINGIINQNAKSVLRQETANTSIS